jgi:hypothetical protein
MLILLLMNLCNVANAFGWAILSPDSTNTLFALSTLKVAIEGLRRSPAAKEAV